MAVQLKITKLLKVNHQHQKAQLYILGFESSFCNLIFFLRTGEDLQTLVSKSSGSVPSFENILPESFGLTLYFHEWLPLYSFLFPLQHPSPLGHCHSCILVILFMPFCLFLHKILYQKPCIQRSKHETDRNLTLLTKIHNLSATSIRCRCVVHSVTVIFCAI